jgi:hypothetical protein
MYDFTGCECPVCHQRFRPDDDMVVCPDCGAPYHRACYEKAGRCVYSARHGADFEWTPPDQPAAQRAGAACPACGTFNEAENRFCKNCGAPLAPDARRSAGPAASARPQDGQSDRSPGGFDYSALYRNNTYIPRAETPFGSEASVMGANETIDGIPASDWAAYIGQSSQVYLLLFKQMELLHRRISFSFSAMLFGPLYFFYRKAWKAAAVFSALTLVSYIPTVLYMMQLTESPLVAGLAASVVTGLLSAAYVMHFALMMLRGLYGFYLYKRSAESRIQRIRAEYPQDGQRAAVLRAQGGTSFGAVCLAALAIVGFYVIVELLLGPNTSALLAAFNG